MPLTRSVAERFESSSGSEGPWRREPEALRALAAALFVSGVARASGWAAVGGPSRLQRALLAIELAAPAALVGWQSRLGR